MATVGATSVPHPTEKQIKQTLKNTKYSHPGQVARAILATIETFNDLKPSVKEYSFPTGKRADLMQLSGTIPVTIVDHQYNIPIRVWLPKGYPKERPLVYVNPTADMAIASAGYLERDGKVDVPYLAEWKEGRSDLTTLVQVVRFKFSQQCPVYTVRKTPLIPRTSSSTLPRVVSMGQSHAPQTPGGLTYSPKKENCKDQCSHVEELKMIRKEIEDKKVEINMLKSSLIAANKSLEIEKAHIKEMEQSKTLAQRGSFTSGLIDAMQQEMQQQIVTERQLKEKYKQRLDAMVTEITQVREEIGIVRVDKEDYEQRVVATMSELQHAKKKMHEMRSGMEKLKNQLSTVQGKFEAAETNYAKEQVVSESLRRELKEMSEELEQQQREVEQKQDVNDFGGSSENDDVQLGNERRDGENEAMEELKQKLMAAEEKLALATNKAMEIEKEKDELFNSFMAQISQTSLMEQQLYEEKEQLQLQMDRTLQQLQGSTAVGQQLPADQSVALEKQLEGDEKYTLSEGAFVEGQLSGELTTEGTSDEDYQNMFQFSTESIINAEQSSMVPESVVREIREERDKLEKELKKVLETLENSNTTDLQQPSITEVEEHQLQERVQELTEKLKEKENEASTSAVAYSELMAERNNIKEKLDDVLCTIKIQEGREEEMKIEIQELQEQLKCEQEDAEKLRARIEAEAERLKLSVQLEAELMEKTCVVSQITGEKVALQFSVKQLQQQLSQMKEKTGKMTEKLETDLIERSSTVDQLTKEREDLLRKIQELQKQVQESLQQSEPQICDKDVVSYEEIKLTQNMVGTGAWGYVMTGTFRGKVVAVKCLHKNILSQFSKSQIQREISIMAELRHPNLVLFIAAVLDAPTGPMIVTELLSYTLRRAYREEIVTSNLEKLWIMQDVALALNYLHLQHTPIIHRDISSSNVLLEELAHKQWRAKLSDFGSANLVRFATTPGEGALVYSAPEMRTEAHQPQSPSADVYSYGVLLCEVITSCFPSDHSGGLAGIMEKAKMESPLVYTVIEKCLSMVPSDRPIMDGVIMQLEQLITTLAE